MDSMWGRQTRDSPMSPYSPMNLLVRKRTVRAAETHKMFTMWVSEPEFCFIFLFHLKLYQNVNCFWNNSSYQSCQHYVLPSAGCLLPSSAGFPPSPPHGFSPPPPSGLTSCFAAVDQQSVGPAPYILRGGGASDRLKLLVGGEIWSECWCVDVCVCLSGFVGTTSSFGLHHRGQSGVAGTHLIARWNNFECPRMQRCQVYTNIM